MALLRQLLLLKLVAMILADRDSTPTQIHMAAILPDARRYLSTAHAWPFSIQNVSPAIDIALHRVNNDRITFDVK